MNNQQRITRYVKKHMNATRATHIIDLVANIVSEEQRYKELYEHKRDGLDECRGERNDLRAQVDELKTTIDRLTKQEALYQQCLKTDEDRILQLTENLSNERLKTTITRESLLEVIRELVGGKS